jgi:anti-sigma regulatory factor (Ser/Thr protein kinase)
MSERQSRKYSRDFAGSIEAVSDADTWLASQFGLLGIGGDTEFAINLCVEELFLNAVQHGHANQATISIWTESDGVRVEFVDDGEPFDPTRAAAVRINGPNDDFPIGGYGTGLVHKFSRRMGYRRSDGHNRVLLEFDADGDAGAGAQALRAT